MFSRSCDVQICLLVHSERCISKIKRWTGKTIFRSESDGPQARNRIRFAASAELFKSLPICLGRQSCRSMSVHLSSKLYKKTSASMIVLSMPVAR